LLCCVAADAELDLLARLVEQEANEQESPTARCASVAAVESDHAERSGGGLSTISSVDISSNCSISSDPVASTGASMPETNEEC